MNAPYLIVSEIPATGSGLRARRVLERAKLAAQCGGVTLIAPKSGGGPVLVPGVRHIDPQFPPGMTIEDRGASMSRFVAKHLESARPQIAHCFGFRGALPCLIGAGARCRVAIEPGVSPSQHLRMCDPELRPDDLTELVSLEHKVLERADAIVARSTVETLALIQRGVDRDRVWTIPDGLAFEDTSGPPGILPLIGVVCDHPMGLDGMLAAEAFSFLKMPWRAVFYAVEHAAGSRIEKRIRELRLDGRISRVVDEGEFRQRVTACRLILCASPDERALITGGWIPEALGWGLASSRPLLCADVPITRAYAGGAAAYFSPGSPSAMATGIEGLLGDMSRWETIAQSLVGRRAAFSWEQSARLTKDLWVVLGNAL